MNKKNGIILIPARYHSTRFPGKPLTKISGKSMIERVYSNCKDSGLRTVIVTDDDRIEEHVNNFDGEVVRVDDQLASGTERIYTAYDRFFRNDNISFVINVQGDEPLLIGSEIEKLVNFHMSSSFDVATIVKNRSGQADIDNSNVVKAIYSDVTDQCLYFSRAKIPFLRGRGVTHEWYQHIGIYSYKVDGLKKFSEGKVGKYELMEALEQLRALELGLTIGAVVTELDLIGVDSPEDIKKVEGALSGKRSE